MKHIIIAPFEGNAGTVLSGIKEFPTEKIIFLAPVASLSSAETAKKEFESLKIPVEIVILKDASDFEEVFSRIKESLRKILH